MKSIYLTQCEYVYLNWFYWYLERIMSTDIFIRTPILTFLGGKATKIFVILE